MSDERRAKLVRLIRAVQESAAQAPHDFCGDQRDWHLPRLQLAMLTLMELFPTESYEAFEGAKTPYGDAL